MSFDKEFSEILGLTLWELKPSFKTAEEKLPIKKVDIKPDEIKLIFSNSLESNKNINLFISNQDHLSFFKSISFSLFFNSKVNIYHYNSDLTQNTLENSINIYDKDILKDFSNINSSINKKYIFSKLYESSDFTSK
ncbi:chloroquine resistance protein [Pseudofrancisella aestuarii]|uniref:Chloroquine resistance protein n=1 Tax=Pseudofrancisella aestuarii TaxID=2670347 RepID=A0ABV9T9C5_9GAMM|nr:chloroquine resistance protein [Pseudofrancisella aestuarii]